ncbi:Ca-activated chloride channel family protein [Actinokineospora auranticolor]|uniref:Ca-activated chloride channel family protein n=2 Tax=Actinokineospora auranticolor TaxID=155976 RepID=A0A2S6GVF0_9PSEU|nr:Ca-activated chloride channel family protein [Actinokineospora auranticolor]
MSHNRVPAASTRAPAAVLALACLLTACTTETPAPVTLTVLAPPELSDVQPLLADLRRETGVELRMEYVEDADRALVPGQYRHDLAWLSTDRYLELRAKRDGYPGGLPTGTPVMESPLVLGVRGRAMPALTAASGGRGPTWADVADRAAAGVFRFAMADPDRSGSGLAALVGVATAATRTGGALEAAQVSCAPLGGFLTGKTRGGQSERDAVAAFTDHDDVDAVIAHESTLLTRAAAAGPQIVRPRDGMVLSRFPLLLLDPAKREPYQRAVDWLLAPTAQNWIMEHTARRSVDPALPRPEPLRPPIGNALYFPARQEVLDALLSTYRDLTTGRAQRVVYVLDYSNSMAGPRVERLREVFAALSGTGSGGFDRFHLGETITVVRFAGGVLAERSVTVRGASDLTALAGVVAAPADGRGTAIWSALEHAFRGTRWEDATGSVVVITDGENNAGASADDFLRARAAMPEAARKVPVFAVRLGDADPVELDRVARETGGRLLDPATSSLLDAVRGVRGCR